MSMNRTVGRLREVIGVRVGVDGAPKCEVKEDSRKRVRATTII